MLKFSDFDYFISLTHLIISRMNFPFSTNRMSLFQILGVLGGIFHFYSKVHRIFCKQTLEADLGLHCSPMSHKKDARLIWVNHFLLMSSADNFLQKVWI